MNFVLFLLVFLVVFGTGNNEDNKAATVPKLYQWVARKLQLTLHTE